MHFISAVVVALMSTSVMAAPKPQTCKPRYVSEGGGDGFVCYKIGCNKTFASGITHSLRTANVEACTKACYETYKFHCVGASYVPATRTCNFHADDEEIVAKQGSQISYNAHDVGKCLD